jgi:putative spermidine/putrescine transport system substrate-binding protein
MAPFSKATGIRVVDTGPPDLAKIKAMVETKRVEWDVVQVEADFVHRGRTENLLERLDYKVISTRDVLPEAIDDYGITFQFGATSIAYRTDTFPAGNGPKSWADFWDVRRFPGRRALPKQTYHLFPAALAADGVPRDKLYPIDVDRVLRSLERIRPHVVKFFEGFPQAAQLIADKEVDMAASSVNHSTERVSCLYRDEPGHSMGRCLGHPSWSPPQGCRDEIHRLRHSERGRARTQGEEDLHRNGKQPDHSTAGRGDGSLIGDDAGELRQDIGWRRSVVGGEPRQDGSTDDGVAAQVATSEASC